MVLFALLKNLERKKKVLNTITSAVPALVHMFGILNVKVVCTHTILLQRWKDDTSKMCDR